MRRMPSVPLPQHTWYGPVCNVTLVDRAQHLSRELRNASVTNGGCCAELNRTTQHRGRSKNKRLLAALGTQVGSPKVGKQIQTGNRQENSCRAGRGQKHE